jgi:hypothetical protein
MLALPEDYLPQDACFAAGIRQFQTTYAAYLKDGCSLATLLAIGRRAWREHRQGAKQSQESDSSAVPEEIESHPMAKDKSWCPEAVSARIETVIRQGGQQIRKARLLVLLSECTLAWELHTGKLRKRLLIIKNAQIQSADELSMREVPQTLSSGRKRHQTRIKSFDLNGYDRMRIISTEIRRLVNEKRALELRLNNSAVLKTKDLEKVFEWL